MVLKNIQQIQDEIGIVWEDGIESYIPLERLRRQCPCASCAGEHDVMGKKYKAPPTPYKPESFQLISFHPVGGYAINFTWRDGHNTGIYPYPYLKKLGEMS